MTEAEKAEHKRLSAKKEKTIDEQLTMARLTQRMLDEAGAHSARGLFIMNEAAKPSDVLDARTYAALTPLARSKLSSSDAKRYGSLREAHARRIAALRGELAQAKSFTERRRIGREIDVLTWRNTDGEGPSAA